jgi:hypothetical protein
LFSSGSSGLWSLLKGIPMHYSKQELRLLKKALT